MNEQPSTVMGPRRPGSVTAVSLVLGAALLLMAAECPAAPLDRDVWTAWFEEGYTLEPGESLQFPVAFTDIPVRSWILQVDGGEDRCDVSVVRRGGDELLYSQIKESRHQVTIPWGPDEEVLVAITSRDNRRGMTNEENPRSVFVVRFMGPPREQVPVVYSYHVNRALEAFAAGQRLEAERQCEEALRADPDDDVAKVMQAGFLRDRRNYDVAASLVDEALAGDLSPAMRTLAEDMRAELLTLRAPLPAPLREGIVAAEDDLDHDRPESALAEADQLLASDLQMSAAAKSRLHLIRGRALAGLQRNFEAIDAYTTALQRHPSRAAEAVIYFHMGRLYLEMGNMVQAQGAYTFALQNGLPSALDMQAREDLQSVEAALREQQR